MEIDDGFIEFQSYNDQQSLQASFSRARERNKDLSIQRNREELIEDYFNYCVTLKSTQAMDVRATMITESYYLIYASVRNDPIQDDQLPARTYAVTLTDYNNNKSQIIPNNLSNDQLYARITPCFSINQHLAQKLQSTQISISKILLYLSDLQTISQKENMQDSASVKSGSRRNSNDNL